MNDMELIENYILYLIGQCGLSVTLHPMEEERLITMSPLMRFNVHANSYCTRVKSAKGGHAACLEQQARVLAHCRRTGEPFCGVCHAGVFEYVYPIRDAQHVVGFISVGGYATDASFARIERTAERFPNSAVELRRASEGLQRELPDIGQLDTLILPLCRMLELAYGKAREEEETVHARMLRYVQQHYDEDLTSEQICRQFYCSRSHFSHSFKELTGMGFREYLTEIRLKRAKQLLAYSQMSVTEIAYAVGFNDANYFSNVFRKHGGISALAYRKRQQSKESAF